MNNLFRLKNFYKNNEKFVEKVYLQYLDRAVDSGGAVFWLEKLNSGFERSAFIDEVKESFEYKNKEILKNVFSSLHNSRKNIIIGLPNSPVIVDLGGGAIGDDRGAMVLMGYPYAFESLTIIEPPPNNRHQIYKDIPDVHTKVHTEKGVVQYLYGSMADLSHFESNSVDLVFSGETIEHVTVDDCKKTLREVHRILKPSGYFCFDTPNRAITKIQVPNGYINPEHKIEYFHDQMVELLRDSQLLPIEIKGVTYMPKTVSSGIFEYSDIVENVGIYDNYNDCYLLYYKCKAIKN
jgi:SAM-dependent methyltransferase